MAKKILFIFFSGSLAVLSFIFIKEVLSESPKNYTITETILNAFIINLYITGVFAFIGFVIATNKILGSKYYIIKNSKLLIKIYKLLGVDFFRRLLLFFFWGMKKNRVKYFNGTKGGLKNFIYQSKQSEFGHLAAFNIILLISVVLLFKGFILIGIITSIINLIGNFYPIILQRYHRIRIEKILSP